MLEDHNGWYVTFNTADTARRAAMFLNSGARTLARHSVNVVVHPAPALKSLPPTTTWTDEELLDHAEKLIMKDLKALLQQDIMEQVVNNEIRRVIGEEKAKGKANAGPVVDGRVAPDEQAGRGTDPFERLGLNFTSLKGLSFRKQKKRVEEVKPPVVEEVVVPPPAPEPEPEPVKDDLEQEEPPRKKPKKAVPKVIPDEDIESEDDMPAPVVTITITKETIPRKRAPSISTPVEEPPKKKSKKADAKVKDAPAKRTKKSTKKAEKVVQPTIPLDELIHEVIPHEEEFIAPAVAQVHVTASYKEPPEPPRSPVQPKKVLRQATPPKSVDPYNVGICADDEDEYFAKLALDDILHGRAPPTITEEPEPSTDDPPPFRVHVTGSARTEGYYKISHAEKSAYVAQYATRTTTNEAPVEEEQPPQPTTVVSSRSNRANARRRAQGLEEMNQVQLAMALSKGESAATELVKFNQLQTRKKHLRFARSPIHDWGLYAMEKISRGEMVIEYVGEVIRAQVADKREKAYERQGIGSSYLFRIDEDLVVDATKKGNLGYVVLLVC